MPRIKSAETPFAGLARLIRGYGYGATRLAAILQCSRQTAMTRMNNPEQFTLEELCRVVRSTEIPADEMREAVKFS